MKMVVYHGTQVGLTNITPNLSLMMTCHIAPPSRTSDVILAFRCLKSPVNGLVIRKGGHIIKNTKFFITGPLQGNAVKCKRFNVTNVYSILTGANKWNILELFPICSVSHSLDHSYMVATKDYPPDALCRLFAILLLTFILAQSIMVTFTAINCFYMVVMERRFKLGTYDWRLLVPAFGGPLVLGIGAAIPGILGAGPMW